MFALIKVTLYSDFTQLITSVEALLREFEKLTNRQTSNFSKQNSLITGGFVKQIISEK
ncbi:hypothetical protein [Acinetobacter bereziniae]|uniref:hypothetical protein n=1 Tax=Acinetobacter bereziniae TaxID=106648 RepID=UPI001580E4FE|nr:hypothetical protein [Acinetobacter bereziniae]